MYTVGSLADLISGSDTPKKQAVKVKEFKYQKPNIKTTKIIKKFDKFAAQKNGKQQGKNKFDKPAVQKNEKQQGKTKFEKPAFKKQKNVKQFGKPTSLKNVDKSQENKTQIEQLEQQKPLEILKNKKLTNAEKRVMLKRKSDLQPTKKVAPKKPKMEPESQAVDDKTIFVGNVPLDTKEKELKRFFSQYGNIESVRFRGIPTADMKTPKKVALYQKKFHPNRKSMLAYVVFKSNEDAMNARNANGKEFKNHHLRIDYLYDETEHDKKKCIFIGNIPSDAEEEDIRKLFDICGNIHNIRLIRERETNIGKGFGFVNFDNLDAVELAMQLENVKLGNRELRIDRCINNENKNKKKTADGKKLRERFAIHINNLPKNAKETDIRDLFKKCGKILSVRISTGAQKLRFCYINFENSKAVEKAVNMKTPKLLGTCLKVNECKPKEKKQMKYHPAIYITQVPLKTNRDEIRRIFEDCGNIKYIRLFQNKTRETGVGFVNFDSEAAVEKAIQKTVEIGNKKLKISRKINNKAASEQEDKKDDIIEAEDKVENEESDVDDELLNDLNGKKNWEDDSDSSEAEEDDDKEVENDNDDEESSDDDDE